MSKYVIDDTTLIGIGDAIRTKKGTSAQIPVPDLASEILSIPSGGSMPSWIVSGEMTPQENITEFTVTHDKEIVPCVALLFLEDMNTDATYIHKMSIGIMSNGTLVPATASNSYQGLITAITNTYGGVSEMTDSEVTFITRGGNYNMRAGYTYKYFLFFDEG